MIGVFAQCAGGTHGDIDVGLEVGEAAILIAAEIHAGHYPEDAVVVHMQGGDGGVGQALLEGECLKAAVMVLREAVGGADPESAIVGRRQGGDGVIGKVAVGLVEDDKLVAIEASQAFVGTQPEISIFGLRDGADGVLRQPAFLGPDGTRILCQAFARIECERATGAHCRQCKDRCNTFSHRLQYKTGDRRNVFEFHGRKNWKTFRSVPGLFVKRKARGWRLI